MSAAKPAIYDSGATYNPDAYVPPPASTSPSEAGATSPTADPSGRINIISPDGQAFSVERHELELVKKQGFREETHEQEALRSFGEENKDWNSNAAIRLAVGNVVKGGTFGLIDPNHSDWDPYENAKTELIRAQHPGANIAGHVGGFAAGLVTGAPLFGAASVAGGGVKAAILGGEGVAAGLGRTLLAHAVGAGTEGALISVPNAIKEAAFGDPERAGETLLYGFGAGAVLGLAGGLTSKIAGKMSGKQGALAEAVGSSAEPVSTAAIESKPKGVVEWLKNYAESHAENGALAKDALAAKAEGAATSAASRYAGNAVGGIIGHAIGGPVGGFAGSAVGGMVADKVKEVAPGLLAKGARLVAERLEGGPGIAGITQAFASAGEKLDAIPSILANLGKKGAHAIASYDELPQHVMSEFAGGKAAPGTTQHERFENLSKEITALSSDPERLSATLAQVTEPFARDAPDIAAQYGVKATQALKYLADTMPKAPIQTPFSPPANWKPTDSELADFSRRVHTVQDPFSALQRLKDKTIGAADVETLKAVYPKLYDTMLARIMDYGTSPEVKPIDYQYRIKLALLTGAPLDPSLANIADLQASFAPKDESPKGSGSMPKPSSRPKITPPKETPVERISAK